MHKILPAVLAIGAAIRSSHCQSLIFEDNFETFNLKTWKHAITLGGGGNWEFEGYFNNRSNSFVRDGILYLKPTLTADIIGDAGVESGYTMDLWGGSPADLCTSNADYGCERTSGGGGNYLNPVMSARIRTAESFSTQYGRVEVRAKLPQGDWIWPAIWLLPRYQMYGTWPASGEIDIMESRGNDPSYPAGGCNKFASTFHLGPFPAADRYFTKQYTAPSGTLADDFHVYGLFWNETHMQTYIDEPSNVVLSVGTGPGSLWDQIGFNETTYANPYEGASPMAPFDQEFYIIMNVAVGGTNGYFPDGQGNKPWANTSPHAMNDFWQGKNQWLPTWNGTAAAMQVDYVRVYDA